MANKMLFFQNKKPRPNQDKLTHQLEIALDGLGLWDNLRNGQIIELESRNNTESGITHIVRKDFKFKNGTLVALKPIKDTFIKHIDALSNRASVSGQIVFVKKEKEEETEEEEDEPSDEESEEEEPFEEDDGANEPDLDISGDFGESRGNSSSGNDPITGNSPTSVPQSGVWSGVLGALDPNTPSTFGGLNTGLGFTVSVSGATLPGFPSIDPNAGSSVPDLQGGLHPLSGSLDPFGATGQLRITFNWP